MCGIIGYTGPQEVKKIILDGLRRLEYRGYDSAGVSIFNDKVLKRFRAEGKLSNLEVKLSHEQFNGNTGIGHTRWATHGPPTEKNAHPHIVNGVSIVHNGIIENDKEIREELIKNGAIIQSDTDSELIAHLLSLELKNTSQLLIATQNILKKLKGAFSVLAIWENDPNQMVAFKNGPPLLIGAGKNEIVIASDIQAIIPITRDVCYLEDNEIVFIKNKDISFYDINNNKINKTFIKIDWTPESADKMGYSHYMLKEIFEQPKAVSDAIKPFLNENNSEIVLQDQKLKEELSQMNEFHIIACGTSYYAAMIGKFIIEQMARIQVHVHFASEFRYQNPIFKNNQLALFITQSGETADTLEALRLCKKNKVKTISLCNVKHSTIDRESDFKLYMNAGSEIGVASTKALTSTVSVLVCLSHFLTKLFKLNFDFESHLKDILSLPSLMEKVLTQKKEIEQLTHHFKNTKGFLYLGRGINFPVALEGALKMKELAYIHAEGYAAGEMKHGPIALIDEKMMIIAICPQDSVYEKTINNLEETKARGGKIISIGEFGDKKLAHFGPHFIGIQKTHWSLTPLLTLIPLQLIAFNMANYLGLDVDKPRNLAKSVTVE